jgi:hypothetical protein
MKSIYRSVISYPVLVVSIGALLFLLFVAFQAPWPLLLVILSLVLLAVAILLPIYLYTVYIIDGDTLKIRCGWIIRKNIAIANIREIRQPVSVARMSPALATKKGIDILYTKYDSVVISPERRGEFIAKLQVINPEIKVSL